MTSASETGRAECSIRRISPARILSPQGSFKEAGCAWQVPWMVLRMRGSRIISSLQQSRRFILLQRTGYIPCRVFLWLASLRQACMWWTGWRWYIEKKKESWRTFCSSGFFLWSRWWTSHRAKHYIEGLDLGSEADRKTAANRIAEMAEETAGSISLYMWDFAVLCISQFASEMSGLIHCWKDAVLSRIFHLIGLINSKKQQILFILKNFH